jgi:hypothetical protein
MAEYCLSFSVREDVARQAACQRDMNAHQSGLLVVLLIAAGTALVSARPRLATGLFAVAALLAVGLARLAVALGVRLSVLLLWALPAGVLTGLGAGVIRARRSTGRGEPSPVGERT